MQKEVSVKNINMQRRSQLPLFSNEDFKSYFGIRVWIEDFYETIAHSISGGERKERELVDELSCEPDIED